MKAQHRFSNVSIEIGDRHGEPYGLVNAALKRRDSPHRRRRRQGGEYDEVWCVVDVEAPEPQGSLDQAARLAKENGIKIAYANPCFEFWLFLHQRDHGGGYLTTNQAIAKMRGLECCFTEGKDFNAEHFMGDPQRVAIRRAEQLAKRYEVGARPRDRNPWTDIHVLVRDLLDQR